MNYIEAKTRRESVVKNIELGFRRILQNRDQRQTNNRSATARWGSARRFSSFIESYQSKPTMHNLWNRNISRLSLASSPEFGSW